MRKLIILCVFCFSLQTQAQSTIQPRFYVGVDAFNEKLFFNGDGYYGISVGAEILKFKFLAPEIEMSFYGGSIDKQEQLDVSDLPDGYVGPAPEAVGYISGGFTAMVYSFSPKLIFGDADFAFVFLPKYSF